MVGCAGRAELEATIAASRTAARATEVPGSAGPCDPGRVPQIDVVDSTWIGVPPAVLAPEIAAPANWARWWPRLDLAVQQARGVKGMRWRVRSGHGGRLGGTMEIWLQPADDGTVGHFFLRLDSTGRVLRGRAGARLAHAYRARAKQLFWELAARHDPGRLQRVGAPVTRRSADGATRARPGWPPSFRSTGA